MHRKRPAVAPEYSDDIIVSQSRGGLTLRSNVAHPIRRPKSCSAHFLAPATSSELIRCTDVAHLAQVWPVQLSSPGRRCPIMNQMVHFPVTAPRLRAACKSPYGRIMSCRRIPVVSIILTCTPRHGGCRSGSATRLWAFGRDIATMGHTASAAVVACSRQSVQEI